MEKATKHHLKKKTKHIKKANAVGKEKENEESNDETLLEEDIPKPGAEISIEDEIDAILKKKVDKYKKEKKDKESAKLEKGKKEREKNRRYTDDGLPIYTEEELQMNNPKAGTTPLCPFDCDCCH